LGVEGGGGGGSDNVSTDRLIWKERFKAAKFWKQQVEIYEGKIIWLQGS